MLVGTVRTANCGPESAVALDPERGTNVPRRVGSWLQYCITLALELTADFRCEANNSLAATSTASKNRANLSTCPLPMSPCGVNPRAGQHHGSRNVTVLLAIVLAVHCALCRAASGTSLNSRSRGVAGLGFDGSENQTVRLSAAHARVAHPLLSQSPANTRQAASHEHAAFAEADGAQLMEQVPVEAHRAVLRERWMAGGVGRRRAGEQRRCLGRGAAPRRRA